MPGYFIAQVDVHDENIWTDYTQKVVDTIASHQGTLRIVNDNADVREGTWPTCRTIMVEFDTVDQVRHWYESSDNQELIPLRQSAATTSAIIIDGLDAG